jgi:hypothetical protein
MQKSPVELVCVSFRFRISHSRFSNSYHFSFSFNGLDIRFRCFQIGRERARRSLQSDGTCHITPPHKNQSYLYLSHVCRVIPRSHSLRSSHSQAIPKCLIRRHSRTDDSRACRAPSPTMIVQAFYVGTGIYSPCITKSGDARYDR